MRNNKRDKHSGLAEPQVEGVDSLFASTKGMAENLPGADPLSAVGSPTRSASHSMPPEDEPAEMKTRRVKTSLYLSQEALDLLHEIRFAKRKSEGRFVPLGELLDTAVRDLAAKVKQAASES